MNELNIKKEQFDINLTQFDYLAGQNILSETIKAQVSDLRSRFNSLLESHKELETRTEYLDTVIKIGASTDALASKIRSLSAISSRRFLAEEDDCSIQTAIGEQKATIDQMKACDTEAEQLRQRALECSHMDFTRIPVIIYEKITNTQDSVRQCLKEECERRSTLIEIRQASEQKQSKFDALVQNLEMVNRILDSKNPEDAFTPRKPDRRVSFERSLDQDMFFSGDDHSLSQTEFEKYIRTLSRCKEIIQSSRRIVDDLKIPGNTGKQEYQEVREVESRLNSCEEQVDAQLDLFENNLAIQVKLEKRIERLEKALTDLGDKLEVRSAREEANSVAYQIEIDRLKGDLVNVDKLRRELNEFSEEKADILKIDLDNLSQSKVGTLTEGFNEAIYENDLKRDAEFNFKSEQIEVELSRIQEQCHLRINELNYKIGQGNLIKKQNRLNQLRDTLDMELDNLVNLKYFKEEENLLVESDNILLEQGALEAANSSFSTTTDRKPETIQEVIENNFSSSDSESEDKDLPEEDEHLLNVQVVHERSSEKLDLDDNETWDGPRIEHISVGYTITGSSNNKEEKIAKENEAMEREKADVEKRVERERIEMEKMSEMERLDAENRERQQEEREERERFERRKSVERERPRLNKPPISPKPRVRISSDPEILMTMTVI